MVNKMLIDKFNKLTVRSILKFITWTLVFALAMQMNHVWAHASLVKSDPPRRASLSESPSQIQLWFNEEIEAAYASVKVLNSRERNVAVDEPQAVQDDPKSVVLALPALAPGSYKVQFRVLSIDGHVVESSYGFRIKNTQQ
ncbi:hypothetical protein SAMN05421690_11052 [Nitrosomonas sp. Nm51]|uniref:copper resistance CopC family protein n=1 Tax=Nitrosomonas sp. Nm51 TaxID=133720 RepID=UPI0008BD6323|nr:copper resistance CopC family protein [Nitrosomonas sp. Nm51]SER84809.1 hypothetical protein SAMN05421690_11052 [Nitrosomonas sp. Nm51]